MSFTKKGNRGHWVNIESRLGAMVRVLFLSDKALFRLLKPHINPNITSFN